MTSSRWLRGVPFLLAVVPGLMAWRFTCPVPHADQWSMTVVPYVTWQQGGSFWAQIHEQGNDSRHDASKLLDFALVKLTHGDLRAQSLMCVLLGLLLALATGWMLRRSLAGAAGAWREAVVALGAALVLTPHQWMNWTFGVQICYVLAVLGAVLVPAVFQTAWPLGLRTVLAGLCAMVATFSFLNGWFAWGLGGLCLLREWRVRRDGRREALVCAGLWLVMMAGAAGLFLQGAALSSNTAQLTGAAAQVKHAGAPPRAAIDEPADRARTPRAFAEFFLNVLGSPFSEGWPQWDRKERARMNEAVAPVVSVVSLLLLAGAWAAGCRSRWRVGAGGAVWPVVLITLYGLGNAAAVTYARTGVVVSGPFQSRYIAFVIWFHIGLLGLLGFMEGRGWRVVRTLWLGVLVYGAGVGFVTGWRDAEHDFKHNQIVTAAAALRHVAPEPGFLDSIAPRTGPGFMVKMDALQDMGLLHVPVIRSAEVQAAVVVRDAGVEGALKDGDLLPDGRFYLQGWALDKHTQDMVDAVAVSAQVDGQPERWLGLAQRRLPERRLSVKHRNHAQEQRIGWVYTRGYKTETGFLSDAPLPFTANPLPKGRVTFRAYAFNVSTGVFTPLPGQVVRDVP